MAVRFSKFQTRGFTGWSSIITKANHISMLGGQNQNVVSEFFTQVMARNFGQSIDSELSKFPTKMFADDSDITWDVYGSARRNIPLVKAFYEDGTTAVSSNGGNAGANGKVFFLLFDEAYFFKGEVIMGNLNQVYPVRIKNDPKTYGSKYLYECESINGSNDGLPYDRLQPGERFSYAYAPVERGLSKEVGGVRHSAPMKARNEFTMIRLHDEASGDVYNKKVAIGATIAKMDASGKQVKVTPENGGFVWMHYWDYVFAQTWSEYKNNVYYYSVANRKANGEYMNFGVSGEVIKQGDGILAQLERGNVVYYNDFSLKVLEDALLRISSAKIELGQGRHFALHTGEAGARLFSNAVRNAMSGWTEFQFNGDGLGVVKKTSSPMHETALSAGYQFTRYSGPMGIVLDVVLDAQKDDPVNNKMLMDDGTLASAARFDVYDMGNNNEPNVYRCGIEGQPVDARSYMWGPRNPFTGQWGNPNMSYTDDKASVDVLGTFAAVVRDVTKVFSMIPAVLAA